MTDQYMVEARKWLEEVKKLAGLAKDEKMYQKRLNMLEWLIEQAEKVERHKKAIKECVERMNEGGPGTRSFVYETLKKALEGRK